MTSDKTQVQPETMLDVPPTSPSFYEELHESYRTQQARGISFSDDPDVVFGRLHLDFTAQEETLVDWAQRNFSRADADKNGFVTKEEILLGYRCATQREQLGYAGLYKFYNEMQNAHNDEWGSENDGITQKDLDAYQTVVFYKERARRSRVDE